MADQQPYKLQTRCNISALVIVVLIFVEDPPYLFVESPRLPAPYHVVVRKDYSRIGLPVNEVGSWLFCSDENGSSVHGDIILVKYKPVKVGKKMEADIIQMTEANIRYLVKRFDLDLVLEDDQE